MHNALVLFYHSVDHTMLMGFNATLQINNPERTSCPASSQCAHNQVCADVNRKWMKLMHTLVIQVGKGIKTSIIWLLLLLATMTYNQICTAISNQSLETSLN